MLLLSCSAFFTRVALPRIDLWAMGVAFPYFLVVLFDARVGILHVEYRSNIETINYLCLSKIC